MRRRLAVNVTLAVASVVLAAALLELGARALGLTSGFFLQPKRANCLRRSALLSLEFLPNCAVERSSTPFRTNAIGLRGPELRDDGATRILAVGDSCTWGWRVAQEDSYPMVLQKKLDERVPSPRFEVINAGFPGFTSYQGMLYLRERGLSLRPSVVIIGFGYNDLSAAGDIERQLRVEKAFMPVLRLDDFFLERSAAYRWARWHAVESAGGKLAPRATPDQYGANLRQMVRLARDANAKVLMLSFWSALGAGADYRNTLYDLTTELQVPIIEYLGPKMDLVHPTSEGHQQLAELVFERLRQEGDAP